MSDQYIDACAKDKKGIPVGLILLSFGLVCTIVGLNVSCAVFNGRITKLEQPDSVIRPVFSQEAIGIDQRMFPLSDIVVKDGDTIRADILLPWGIVLNDQDIRAADYDAWETSKRRHTVVVTEEEIVKGAKAKALLVRLYEGGGLAVSPTAEERDVYGRILGVLSYRDKGKWKNVGEFMEEKGHTRK